MYGLGDYIEELQNEIEQLKAENVKLKEQLEEAKRFSMFQLPAGAKVLINRLQEPQKRRKKS